MDPAHIIANKRAASIQEIENDLKSKLNTLLSTEFSELIAAGRINGNLENMITRIEDESIMVFRENWVK